MQEEMKSRRVKRRHYSSEFKDRALLRVEQEGVAQVARDLGVSESMLYNWRTKQRTTGQPFELQKQQQAELARLKRENAFLKKAASYFAKEKETDI